ncbi:MAG: hypothetical protein V4736_05980 [Bdellovibrionota bacterium]
MRIFTILAILVLLAGTGCSAVVPDLNLNLKLKGETIVATPLESINPRTYSGDDTTANYHVDLETTDDNTYTSQDNNYQISFEM